MELFIDSADIKQIEKYSKLQLFKGITTTPTFFYRQGIYDFEKEIKNINKIVNGEIQIEAMGDDVDTIVKNARKNSTYGDNFVSKIPISFEGLEAVRILKNENIKTNVHLIFSLNQAILAVKAGATYICPLIGRINDIGGNGFNLLKDIVTLIKNYNFETKVMASSIRNAEDVSKAMLIGADAITIPPKIIEKMIFHPLTRIGVDIFIKDIYLSKKVSEIMKVEKDLPLLSESSNFFEVLKKMTEKNIGLAIITQNKKIIGIITDGDIRRIINNKKDTVNVKIKEVMNSNPITVKSEIIVSEALELMEEKRITTLIVINDDNIPIGYLNLHDVLAPIKSDFKIK